MIYIIYIYMIYLICIYIYNIYIYMIYIYYIYIDPFGSRLNTPSSSVLRNPYVGW